MTASSSTRARPVVAGRLELAVAAKINLTLEVVAPRPDGYHDIRSVMQTIDLYDRLELGIAPGDALAVETSNPALPTGGQNLAGMAARRLLETLGLRAAVSIDIDKHIPAGAGLGGGSADAAATLWGLNHLLGRPCGAAGLYRLAAAVGSDVPFFLAGGTCVVSGRGDRVRRLPALTDAMEDCCFLLLVPPLTVETQWAYTNRARIGLTPERGYTRMLASAIRQRSTSLMAESLANDLAEVVARHYQVVEEAKELLCGVGAVGAQLSGSGSAVFGLMRNPREAEAAALALRGASHPVHVARPVRTAIVPRDQRL